MNEKISHPSGISQVIVDKVVKRRGRLHAFETLDPNRTALVVVDLDTRTMEMAGNGDMREFAPRVNAVVDKLREKGGTVAWVTTPVRKASPIFIALYGEEFARMHEKASLDGGGATTVWKGLHGRKGDLYVEKKGASAFFPGNCELPDRLKERDIKSVFIAGMVTNVCCESTARDACELDYQVTLISDALWGHKQGQHEASLATFFRNFGDVRPSGEVMELLGYRITLQDAIDWGNNNQLEAWVHRFLKTEGGNEPFSHGLKLAERKFFGPVSIKTSLLSRCCGPEKDLPFVVEEECFEGKVANIIARIQQHDDLPPLIINYADSSLVVNDGNHRLEAFKRCGYEYCPVVIWTTGEEDMANFKAVFPYGEL